MSARTWSFGLVSLAVALAVYSIATRTVAPVEPSSSTVTLTMIIVTPVNATGAGIPEDWALVRNGHGLTYWAAPSVWKELERK